MYIFHPKNVQRKNAQHLTKKLCFPLFIGPPDGEVFLYHLTKHLTIAPTIPSSSTTYALI